MPVEVVMPKLGLTMTEGMIVEWRKKEGEEVKKGEILFVLETEKVTYEVEAPEDGILGRILVQKQETVPVGAVVAYLFKAGESVSDIAGATKYKPASQVYTEGIVARETSFMASRNDSSAERVRATPLAKKIARQNNIDIAIIKGSGPGGRIVKEDVEKAKASLEDKHAAAPVQVSQAARAASPTAQAEVPEGARLEKFTSMRRAIAVNMLASKIQAAQAYMDSTCDASNIQKFREILLPYIEKKTGVRVTITDILMKITGGAISAHPVINTRWTEEGVLFLPDVHMGMAMALDNGLIVPVIRNINSKNIAQVAKERVTLIKKGRDRTFLPDDIKGGTFTFSNMGMFGIEHFTAIINQPESAILSAAAIIDKPVVVGGEIVIKPMLNVSLTYDHRIIDGAEAGKFMMTLKLFIEKPDLHVLICEGSDKKDNNETKG
jgi:pyruvate dehydrogenase E2 component (dihydrolipoamide acetyltransferase)